MEDWKSAIIEVLEEIDRDANLTKDIYPLFQKNMEKAYQELGRRQLEIV